MKSLRRSRLVAGLLFLSGTILGAQDPVSITGHVSAGGNPVQGATVQIRELNIATTTNADGRFTFIVPSSKVRGQTVNLTARHVRYNPESFPVTLTGGTLVHDFDLFPVGDSRSRSPVESSARSLAGPRSQAVAPGAVTLDSTAFDEIAGPTDLVSALAGRVVGLDVTSAGSLGGSSLAVLRGFHTILGNTQPLFVVDGIPLENTDFATPDQPFGSGGFDYGRPIADIEPAEIASIQVLRGPAAARFGGRGANGVILITTRSGRGLSGFEVAASQNVTTESPLKLPSFQNAYGQGLNGQYSFFDGAGGGTNDGVAENWGPALQGQAVAQASLKTPKLGDVRPWLAQPNDIAAFYNGGTTLTTTASAQQADDHQSFRLSLHRRATSGVVPTNTLTRQGATLSAEDEVTSALTLSGRFDVTSDVAHNRPATGSDSSNTIGDFARMGRQVDLAALKANATNVDGEQISWIYTAFNNPYFALQDNANRDDRTRVTAGGSATYALSSSLRASGRFGVDHYAQTRDFDVASTWMGGFPFYAGRGDFSQGGFQRQKISASETNLAAEVADDVVRRAAGNPASGTLTLSGGVDHRENSLGIDSRGSDQRPDTGTGPSTAPSTINGDNSTTGVFAAADWGVNDFTHVVASARNEWYSLLKSGNNSAFYPSIIASADLARASGARGDNLTAAVVHAGWSRSGGEVSPLVLRSVFVPSSDSGTTSISASSTLGPEITNSLEAGVSLSFLRNRASVDLTLYDEQTSGVILGVASASTIVASNVASLSNKGIELQGSLVPIRTAKGASWRIDAHIAKNANNVDDLSNGATAVPLGPSVDGVTLEARKGSALGALVGSAFRRDASGALLLQNGTPVSNGQQQVLGTMAPSWSGGVGSTVHVGPFDASALVDARMGGSIFSTTNFVGQTTGTFAETANRPDSGQVYPGIDVATGKANTVRATTQAYYHALAPIQEAWVYDASFVKLRDVRVSFSVPLRGYTAFAAQTIRVSLIGRNLAMWSKAPNIDPETALSTTSFQGLELGQLPTVRSWGIQVSLTP